MPRTFRITIPKSAANGQRLRLAGKGGPGFNGGRAGDLYVSLVLQPHPLYRPDGRDLYIDLPLAPWEAVLGASVRAHPRRHGGTQRQTGHDRRAKLRLAKRGLASADGNIGALYAVVRIEVPKTVGAREHELLQQLAAASNFNPRKHFA